jgi:hypothetical protein
MHMMTCSPFRKQDSESLVDVGVRLEKAMQAIQNLCPANFKIEQLDEELQCMALIHTLPDEYHHLSSNLLLVEKLDKAMSSLFSLCFPLHYFICIPYWHQFRSDRGKIPQGMTKGVHNIAFEILCRQN